MSLIKYRPEIDGLRTIAVLSVIIYHAEFFFGSHHIFQGGFFGVDIFFVISGFLITSLITKELNDTSKFSFLNFYDREYPVPICQDHLNQHSYFTHYATNCNF